MNHKWRNFFYVLLLLSTVFSQTVSAYAEAAVEQPVVSAPEYVLMDCSERKRCKKKPCQCN